MTNMIMPHFKTEDLKHINFTDEVLKAVQKLPKDKLVIMDNNWLETEGDIIEIYQDFQEDIYEALKEGEPKKKYSSLISSYPISSLYPFPKRILRLLEDSPVWML